MGRVRLPGQGDVYFGPAGVWPAGQKKPPASVVKDYQKAVSNWLARGGLEAPPLVPEEGATCGDLAAAYLSYAEKTFRKRGKPTKLFGHANEVCKPMVRLFGDLPAECFGPQESRAIREELLRDGKRSKTTVQQYHARLKAMWGWAEREGIISQQAMLSVRAVVWFHPGILARETPGKKQPVPLEDVEATLPHIPEAGQAMIGVQLVSAMRPVEVVYLRASDLEETDGLLKYTASEDANKMAHKKIVRVVYFGDKGQAILQPWLEAARQEGPDAYLFPSLCKRQESDRADGYRLAIALACRKAGVKRWSPGRLRHTRSMETEGVYGLAGSSAELGHTSSNMTKKHYTHALRDELQRKIARESG